MFSEFLNMSHVPDVNVASVTTAFTDLSAPKNLYGARRSAAKMIKEGDHF